VIKPQRDAAIANANATNVAAVTQQAANDMLTQQAAAATATLPPSDTPAPTATETLVVVFASATASPAPSVDPGTATVQALQTQLAFSQQLATQTAAALAASNTTGTPGTPGKSSSIGSSNKTGTPGTPGTPGSDQLAKTGAGDQYGLPSLFFAAILVIAVIMLTRRLRQVRQ